MKQKVISVFEKNVRTFLRNKKAYLMPSSRHGHFHPILILLVKMVELPQQHAITTVHWLEALPLPIVAKIYALKLLVLICALLPHIGNVSKHFYGKRLTTKILLLVNLTKTLNCCIIM